MKKAGEISGNLLVTIPISWLRVKSAKGCYAHCDANRRELLRGQI